MRTRHLPLVFAIVSVVLAFAACTLNPQPLPPLEPESAASDNRDGFGGSHDAGSRTDDKEPTFRDASAPPPNVDADAGDAGAGDADAGDAGDTDAGAGDAGAGDDSDPD